MPPPPDDARVRGEPTGGRKAPPTPGLRGAIVLAAVCAALLGLVIVGRYVGTVSEGAAPASTVLPDMRLDLNAAEAHDLRELPGVGPTLAEAIVAHREEHGPFANVDDLRAVRGVGEKTIERLRPFLVVK